MSKKKIEGLADQAVSKFFKQPETEQQEEQRLPRNVEEIISPTFAAETEQQEEQRLPQVPRSNKGRPRTIYREYEKTSQEGLRDGYTRATFIVREDLLKKLKDYAYTERETLKDVVNKMIAQFLEGKEIIEREDK